MALELDQKDTNMVKTLIDKLHSEDDIHEENEFQLWTNYKLTDLPSFTPMQQFYRY